MKSAPKKPKKKKVRRVVLGVGHPWFSASRVDETWPTEIKLYDSEDRRGTGPFPAKVVALDIGTVGNYNKIRLVAEILK